MILLALCITATIYGTVIISSATAYVGSSRYVVIQLAAMFLGIVAYVILTLIDVDGMKKLCDCYLPDFYHTETFWKLERV